MSTLERYYDNDNLCVQISCDDGRIVKCETWCIPFHKWVDCTKIARQDVDLTEFADKEWREYLEDKKRSSETHGSSLREIFSPIFGVK